MGTWKTEWKRSLPSAARLSLSDWNFLAFEEAHALETKGQNLGRSLILTEVEPAKVTYTVPCHPFLLEVTGTKSLLCKEHSWHRCPPVWRNLEMSVLQPSQHWGTSGTSASSAQ